MLKTSKKEEFIALFKANIKRKGADKLLDYLENKTDFFEAPASTKYHNSYVGGLVEHSINVFNALSKKALDKSLETIAICGLLHDICKANFYKKDYRNVKEDNQWKRVPCFVVADQFPFGHGEKSVYLINKYMQLTPDEALSIRWHMGGFDEAVKGGSYALSEVYKQCKLALYLHFADMEATYMMED